MTATTPPAVRVSRGRTRRALRARAVLAAVLATAFAAATGCLDVSGTDERISSHLRFVNAVPDGAPLDILVDSVTLINAMTFRSVGGYFQVDSGSTRLRARSSGTTTDQADDTLNVEHPRAYTVVSTGLTGSVEFVIASDEAATPSTGAFKLRWIHGAPSTGAVDIYVTAVDADIAALTPAIADVAFRENTEFQSFTMGDFRFVVTMVGTKAVLWEQTLVLADRAMRTIVLTDAVGGGAPLFGRVLDY